MGRISGCQAEGVAGSCLVCPLLAGSSRLRQLAMLLVLLAAPAGQAARDNVGIYATNKTGLFLCNPSYCHCMFLSDAPDFLPSGLVFSNLPPSAVSLWVWKKLLRSDGGVEPSPGLGCGQWHPAAMGDLLPHWDPWTWMHSGLATSILLPRGFAELDLGSQCLFQLAPSSCFCRMTSL